MSRLDTPLTIVCTFALVLGLSFAPVPQSLKPIPALAEKPWREVFAQMVLRSTRAPVAVAPLEADSEAQAAEAQEEEPEVELAPVPSGGASQPVRTGFAGAIASERNDGLEVLRGSVGASHTDIIDVCRDPKGADGHACKAYALDPFFTALDAMEAGSRKEPVRIVHFGDSLIASDYISDVLRRRLQKRFGNGGQGLLFIDRPSRLGGLKTRAGDASPGFYIGKVPEPLAGDGIYSFSGVSFQAQGNEKSRFELKGATRAVLHYYSYAQGGDVEAIVDGSSRKRLSTRGERRTTTVELTLPLGSKQLELRAAPGARLFGVVLERVGVGGVTLESIGLPGAFAGAYLKADAESFRQGLSARAPDLNIIMLGGNESLRLDNGWTSLGAIQMEAREFVDRVQSAAPEAACLMVSPLASGVATVGSEIRVRKTTKAVDTVLRDVAAEAGCAFWDALQAQGGEGSVVRFAEAKLMNSDLVHPVRRGADLMGHLFETALQRAYFVRHGPDALADPPGIIDPSGQALSRFFRKLERLEKENKGRVAVVQLGASHTAGHMFTDEARSVLQSRYGDAGRGFIAAGAPSIRLKRANVSRRLSKGWRIRDALKSQPGEYWGLTGVRAVGRPTAYMDIHFCVGCAPSKVPAELQIYYLEEPGMGRIEVKVDDKVVATLPAATKAISGPAARIFSVKTKGEGHKVSLRNTGASEITVFGVSEELSQPGVVYDALGLPGATAITADGFESETLAAQLRERAADLYVLFYGTNESALARFDSFDYKNHYNSLLDTLMKAAPEADCLIMGPTDRMAESEDKNTWQEVSSLRAVIAALRQVAEARGCAFWSARAAMGGKDSIARWLDKDPPEAHWDHVHLNELGYSLLAKMLMRELLDSYGAYLVYAQSPSSLVKLDGDESEKKKKRKR